MWRGGSAIAASRSTAKCGSASRSSARTGASTSSASCERDNKAFAIECKFQESVGTVDEKIPYALDDLRALPMAGSIAYAGKGFSEGVLHMLRASPHAAYCLPATGAGAVDRRHARARSSAGDALRLVGRAGRRPPAGRSRCGHQAGQGGGAAGAVPRRATGSTTELAQRPVRASNVVSCRPL